jgi:hypothetical protein
MSLLDILMEVVEKLTPEELELLQKTKPVVQQQKA